MAAAPEEFNNNCRKWPLAALGVKKWTCYLKPLSLLALWGSRL
jgi:hypothetical protein